MSSLDFISSNAQNKVNDNNYLKLIVKEQIGLKNSRKIKHSIKILDLPKLSDENKNKTKEFESLSKYSNDLNFKLLKSEKII